MKDDKFVGLYRTHPTVKDKMFTGTYKTFPCVKHNNLYGACKIQLSSTDKKNLLKKTEHILLQKMKITASCKTNFSETEKQFRANKARLYAPGKVC